MRVALKHASTVVATALIVSLFVVSLGRLFYPYELEWMEGGSVDHVRWLLAGHPLYVRPTLAFIPYIYAPLYFYLATALCWFVGAGFWPLRLISLAATTATLGVSYALLRHETGNRRTAYLGVALYAGAFSLAGYWFDLARVDSLEILFVALALYFVRRRQSLGGALAAGLWVGLAALTKQTAVAAVLPIGGYLLTRSRARLLVFLVTVGVVGGGGFAILDRLNDGWLRYYTITLPSHHETNAAAYLDFWTQDVSRLLPLGLAALAIGWLARRCDDLPRSALSFYGIVFVVFLGVSYSSRIHAGGARNVVMPAFFAGALLFAIAVHAAAALVEGRGQASKADDPARAARPAAFGIGLHLFTLLQLSLLLYLPWRQLPSSSDRRAGAAFIALLGRLPGDVYVMDHGWYAALAGKPTFAQGMALLDVLRGDRGPVGQQLASELASAVRARRFGAIVVGTTVPTRDAPGDASARRDALWNNGILLPWMPADFVEALRTEYQPAAHLYRDSRDFAPVVGWRRRPAVVYVPH